MLSEVCFHIPDDHLDLYAIGHLPDAETVDCEEHLLLCESCRARLTEADRFIAAFRQASSALAQSERRLAWRSTFSKTLGRFGYTPALLPVFGAAALLLLALTPVLQPVRGPDRPIIAASLQAVRGSDSRVLPGLEPAKVTLLALDVSDLADGPWNIKVVDGSGSSVWKARQTESGGVATLRIERPLEPGSYWVRLYDMKSPSQLVREYGFEVR